MMKKNNNWILIFLFILGIAIFGFYYKDKISQKFHFGEKTEQKEKIDWKFLDEVKTKLEEKFVDTREDQSKKITEKDKLFGAAQGLVASYGDMHTMFFPPEDSKMFEDDAVNGEFSGVGMEITNLGGYLMVVAPLPDSPAAKAGIMPKDIISKIDGKDALSMSSHKAVKLIRGKEGTYVNLEVLRKGKEKPVKIKIKRGKIKIPIVKTFVKDGVFVIKLYSFTENSPKLFFEKILTDFRKAKTDKMIIDLRGNTGGLLSAGVFISGLFLKQGDVIVTEDREGKGKNKTWVSGDIHTNPSRTTNIFKNLKLGILVNGGTASAAEILTGSLLDHKKAIVFGTNTFGKGTVQEVIDFDNGSSMKVTVAKFILPNGEWISYKGIAPDVEIDLDEKEAEKMIKQGSYSNYVDKQLQKAIDYMKKIKNQKDFEKRVEEFAKKRKEKESEKSKMEKAKELLNK